MLNSRLIAGDSKEVLKSFPDNYFSCCVTSPPYNVGKDYGNGHDDNQSKGDYQFGLFEVFKEVRRTLSEEGLLFLNIGDSASDPLKGFEVAQTVASTGLYLTQTIIWAKSVYHDVKNKCESCGHHQIEKDRTFGQYSPVNSPYRLANVFEYVFLFAKSERAKLNRDAIGVPFSDKNNIGRYNDRDHKIPGNVWTIPYETIQKREKGEDHPCPFPLELAKRCLKLAPEGCALDPFAGLATVGAAAKELGRPFVCIDQNGEWLFRGNDRHGLGLSTERAVAARAA